MDIRKIAAIRIFAFAFVALGMGYGESEGLAEDALQAKPIVENRNAALGKEVPVRFVQRRRRSPEWYHLKEMEEYYDDLEDFYKRRDPALSDHYESLEKYYENVRKGKPAYLPSEIVAEQRAWDGPRTNQPESRRSQPGIAVENVNRTGPHTNLERTYRELNRQLSGLTTGDTWLAYFELPFDTQLNSTPLEMLMTEPSKAQFAEALSKFDRIANDPEYRVVARLSAFGRTRNALRSFTQWLERQPTLAEPEVVEGEEIPLPPPASDGPILPPQ